MKYSFIYILLLFCALIKKTISNLNTDEDKAISIHNNTSNVSNPATSTVQKLRYVTETSDIKNTIENVSTDLNKKYIHDINENSLNPEIETGLLKGIIKILQAIFYNFRTVPQEFEVDYINQYKHNMEPHDFDNFFNMTKQKINETPKSATKSTEHTCGNKCQNLKLLHDSAEKQKKDANISSFENQPTLEVTEETSALPKRNSSIQIIDNNTKYFTGEYEEDTTMKIFNSNFDDTTKHTTVNQKNTRKRRFRKRIRKHAKEAVKDMETRTHNENKTFENSTKETFFKVDQNSSTKLISTILYFPKRVNIVKSILETLRKTDNNSYTKTTNSVIVDSNKRFVYRSLIDTIGKDQFVNYTNTFSFTKTPSNTQTNSIKNSTSNQILLYSGGDTEKRNTDASEYATGQTNSKIKKFDIDQLNDDIKSTLNSKKRKVVNHKIKVQPINDKGDIMGGTMDESKTGDTLITLTDFLKKEQSTKDTTILNHSGKPFITTSPIKAHHLKDSSIEKFQTSSSMKSISQEKKSMVNIKKKI